MDGGRGVAGVHVPKLKDGESEKYHLRLAVEDDDHALIRELYEGASQSSAFRRPYGRRRNGIMSSTDARKKILHCRKWLIIETAASDRLGYVQYYPWIEDNALYIVQMELKSGVGVS